jgi:hypothetical protein
MRLLDQHVAIDGVGGQKAQSMNLRGGRSLLDRRLWPVYCVKIPQFSCAQKLRNAEKNSTLFYDTTVRVEANKTTLAKTDIFWLVRKRDKPQL